MMPGGLSGGEGGEGADDGSRDAPAASDGGAAASPLPPAAAKEPPQPHERRGGCGWRIARPATSESLALFLTLLKGILQARRVLWEPPFVSHARFVLTRRTRVFPVAGVQPRVPRRGLPPAGNRRAAVRGPQRQNRAAMGAYDRAHHMQRRHVRDAHALVRGRQARDRGRACLRGGVCGGGGARRRRRRASRRQGRRPQNYERGGGGGGRGVRRDRFAERAARVWREATRVRHRTHGWRMVARRAHLRRQGARDIRVVEGSSCARAGSLARSGRWS